MPVQIHDSLTRSVHPLKTREPGRVFMYTCGPTVYNNPHIGNVRTFVWFDFIRRYLTYRGYEVTYVLNYTDVDDRIIERAAIEKISPQEIARKYARAFEDDVAALGVHRPDLVCRATDHIEEMVKAIESLIEKGAAYEAGGDVFFAVDSFAGYGKLSGRSLEDMRSGERVEASAGKRSPLDFALWKAAKEGEPSWPSPWGKGRPGWHIECSVMSTKYLGMGFDVHGGAEDLIFPHHENEIAQAEALHDDKQFVKQWLHAGLVQMESEKMSKSLGNVVLVQDVIERYAPEAARYWALTGSYRTQVTFSDRALEDAAQAYERLKTFWVSCGHALGAQRPDIPLNPARPPADNPAGDEAGHYLGRFIAALDDDFNTASALAVVHELVRAGNKSLEAAERDGDDKEGERLTELAGAFAEMSAVLGFQFPAGESSSELVAGLVEYLLELREQSRRGKEFERADAIRSRLTDLGVAIEDTPSGARWRVTRGSVS